MTVPAEVGGSSRNSLTRAQRFLLWSKSHPWEFGAHAACLAVLLLQLIVWVVFELSSSHLTAVLGQTSVSVAVNQPAVAAGGTARPGKPSPTPCCHLDAKANEIRKEMQDRIDTKVSAEEKALKESQDAQLARAKDGLDALERLMNREVTLVTIYAVLAALAAGISVVSARAEALEKLKDLEKKTNDAKTETKEFTDKLRTEVLDKFPFLASIEGNIPYILNEIQSIVLPAARTNADPVDGEGDDKPLREVDRQKILVAEMTVAGFALYSLEKSSKFRDQIVGIYNGLARFYWKEMNRRKTEEAANFGEADYLRAEHYASLSRGLAPKKAGVSRFLGSIRAARFQLLRDLLNAGKTPSGVTAETQEQLFKSAKADFETAIRLQKEQIDAGAYYNLALLCYYQADIHEAVRLSRELLDSNGKRQVSPAHRVKYLPDTYLNLAIYLAKQAAGLPASDSTGKQDIYRQVQDTIQAGIADFRRDANWNDGLERLIRGLQKELKEGGDFSAAPGDVKEALRAMAIAAEKPDTASVAANQGLS